MNTHHGFRSTDIRRSMDVFGLDGSHLGTITRVFPGAVAAPQSGTNLSRTAEVRSFDGESTGPAPTREVGNPGPATQSPEHGYATLTGFGDALGDGEIEIATLFGLFRRQRIPMSEIQTVSLERVVLRRAGSEYTLQAK